MKKFYVCALVGVLIKRITIENYVELRSLHTNCGHTHFNFFGTDDGLLSNNINPYRTNVENRVSS